MKLIAVALLSSIVTALLVLVIVNKKLSAPPLASSDILTVKELRVVDDTGAVRVRLGTHSRWSQSGNPALELLPIGAERAGVELDLDKEGRGALLFSTDNTDGKVMVGHFVTGDSLPLSQSDNSWGIRIINGHAAKGAPDTLYFAATETGNVGVSGATIKQALPLDIKPVRAYAK